MGFSLYRTVFSPRKKMEMIRMDEKKYKKKVEEMYDSLEGVK